MSTLSVYVSSSPKWNVSGTTLTSGRSSTPGARLVVESVTIAVVTRPLSAEDTTAVRRPWPRPRGLRDPYSTHLPFENGLRELLALEQRQDVGAIFHDLPGNHERRLAGAILDGDELAVEEPYVGPLRNPAVAEAGVAHGARNLADAQGV